MTLPRSTTPLWARGIATLGLLVPLATYWLTIGGHAHDDVHACGLSHLAIWLWAILFQVALGVVALILAFAHWLDLPPPRTDLQILDLVFAGSPLLLLLIVWVW